MAQISIWFLDLVILVSYFECMKMNELNSLVQDVHDGVANFPLKTKCCETLGHPAGGVRGSLGSLVLYN